MLRPEQAADEVGVGVDLVDVHLHGIVSAHRALPPPDGYSVLVLVADVPEAAPLEHPRRRRRLAQGVGQR